MDRILRRRKVLELTGLSSSTMDREIKKERFPRSIPLSEDGRCVGWISSEIEAWIAKRIESAQTRPRTTVRAIEAYQQ